MAQAVASTDRRDPTASAAASDAYRRATRDLRVAAVAAAGGGVFVAETAQTARQRPSEQSAGDDWGEDGSHDGWGSWDSDDGDEPEPPSVEEEASSSAAAAVLDVRYFPLPCVPMTGGVFVMPARGAAAVSVVDPGRPGGSTTASLARLLPPPEEEGGDEEDGVDRPVPPGVSVLAHSLAALGSHIGCRLECFGLGRTARAVARATAAAAPPAAEAGQRIVTSAALVIVDRTADLLTPAAPHDAFLARVFGAGARRPPGLGSLAPADVRLEAGLGATNLPSRAPMAFPTDPPSVFPSEDDDDASLDAPAADGAAHALMGACLAHPDDPRAREMLGVAASQTATDAANMIRRRLVDALRRERIPHPAGVPQAERGVPATARDLEGLAAALGSDPALALTYRCLIELAAAAAAGVRTEEATNGSSEQRRRRSALACVLREAHAAVEARGGIGAAAAATWRATAACLRDLYGPGRPHAGAAAEAALLVVAGVVVAGEAAALEADKAGEEADPRDRRAAAGYPLGHGEETAVREALVEAVLARPACGGAVDAAAYAWLGEVGARIVDAWTRADDEKEGRRGTRAQRATPKPPAEDEPPAAPPRALSTPGVAAEDSSSDSDWDSWLDDDDSAVSAKKKLEERRRAAAAPPTDASAGAAPGSASAFPGGRLDDDDTLDDALEGYHAMALKLETRDAVEAFLQRVGRLARARRRMTSAGSLLGDGDGLPEPLLRELAGRIGAGADDEGVCADLYHAVSSLGGLLKSGIGGAIGRFGFKTMAKPKPSDHPVVIVFVVGGVTPGEMKEVAAAAAEVAAAVDEGEGGAGKVREIIVGGTGLLSDHDVLRMMV